MEVEVDVVVKLVGEGRYASVRCLATYFPVKPVEPHTSRSSVLEAAAILEVNEWKKSLLEVASRGRKRGLEQFPN